MTFHDLLNSFMKKSVLWGEIFDPVLLAKQRLDLTSDTNFQSLTEVHSKGFTVNVTLTYTIYSRLNW